MNNRIPDLNYTSVSDSSGCDRYKSLEHGSFHAHGSSGPPFPSFILKDNHKIDHYGGWHSVHSPLQSARPLPSAPLASGDGLLSYPALHYYLERNKRK